MTRNSFLDLVHLKCTVVGNHEKLSYFEIAMRTWIFNSKHCNFSVKLFWVYKITEVISRDKLSILSSLILILMFVWFPKILGNVWIFTPKLELKLLNIFYHFRPLCKDNFFSIFRLSNRSFWQANVQCHKCQKIVLGQG